MQGLVVFLNGARGLATLRRINDAGHEVVRAIVPVGHAHDETAGAAAELGVEVIRAAKVNDPAFVARLADLKPKISVIAGYSSIFRHPLFTVPQHGTINLHAGPLPFYRGGSPLNWQIINGEPEIGISVIQVDVGIDTGDVLAERRFRLGRDDTIATVHESANKLFPDMVLEVLERIAAGTLVPRRQDATQARYWHQRNDGDGLIHWRDMSAEQVHRLVRAVTRPYPGAHAYRDGSKIRLWRTELTPFALRGTPGRVVTYQGQGPFVICREGAILLREWEVEDGSDLATGDHLGTTP